MCVLCDLVKLNKKKWVNESSESERNSLGNIFRWCKASLSFYTTIPSYQGRFIVGNSQLKSHVKSEFPLIVPKFWQVKIYFRDYLRAFIKNVFITNTNANLENKE